MDTYRLLHELQSQEQHSAPATSSFLQQVHRLLQQVQHESDPTRREGAQDGRDHEKKGEGGGERER